MFFRKFVLASLLVVAASVAPAQQGAGVEGVIRQQMDAFRADDWPGAYQFASPTIQRIFPSPEVFGQMVRQGYPMVWRPADIRFGALRQQGERALQVVVVEDVRGVPHALEYEMIRLDTGWRINGVRLLRPGDAGA